MQVITKIKNKLGHGTWYPFYNSFYEKVPLSSRMILLESRSGTSLESNILAVIKELSTEPYRSFRLILSVRRGMTERIKKKLQYHGLRADKIVQTGSVAYYYYLSRAGYLVNDTTFPGRFIKKDGQIYLNTWHGTPLKKMGRDNKAEIVVMGNVMRNLLCADYLVFPNQYMEEKMSDAYMLRELFRGTVIHEGYPRNDVFRNPEKGRSLKAAQGFAEKRVIAYLPTFRGKYDQVEETGFIRSVKECLRIWEKGLDEQELLLVKLHPFVCAQIDFGCYSRVRAFPEEWDTNEGLNACDALITDYSSVMYDYVNSGRQVIVYAYDLEKYSAGRGLYEDVTEYPFRFARTPKQVLDALHQPWKEVPGEFLEKYATWEDGKAASRICRQVFLGKACCRLEHFTGDGRENILIYGGNLAQNGITTALCAMLRELDLTKYHYFLSFRSDYLREFPERLGCIPDQVGVFPLASELNADILTVAACFVWLKFGKENRWIRNRIEKAYRREWKKHFGNCRFRSVIHYNGYETYVTSLLKEADCPRTIWVHNDMEQEIRTKQNQNPYLLRDAYRSYDHVVAVSEDILDSIYDISGRKDNVQVISNLLEYQKILIRAEQKVAFDSDTVSNVTLKELDRILGSSGEKFINIGRFSPEKGHRRLITAFDRYWKKHKDSYLIIIGGYGPLYKDIVKYAKSKNACSHIFLLMRVSNPMPILKKCDLFLLSSYYEGLGLVLLEADTLGIPVAACDVPGPRSFLKKHGGMLVENSVEGLVQAMEQYHCGNRKVMHADYEALNRESLKKCEMLLDGTGV